MPDGLLSNYSGLLTGQVRYALWVSCQVWLLVVYGREGGNRAGWLQQNRRNDHNTSNLQTRTMAADLRIGTNWMGRKVFCQQRTSDKERNIEKCKSAKERQMKKMMLARRPSAQTVDLAGREGQHTRKAKESGKERNEGKREREKMKGMASSY